MTDTRPASHDETCMAGSISCQQEMSPPRAGPGRGGARPAPVRAAVEPAPRRGGPRQSPPNAGPAWVPASTAAAALQMCSLVCARLRGREISFARGVGKVCARGDGTAGARGDGLISAQENGTAGAGGKVQQARRWPQGTTFSRDWGPAATVAVAVSSLSGPPAAAEGML
jgi:hypothetical protein